MKVIIDCGGWCGDSVEPLRQKWGDCLVHSFEPVEEMHHYFNGYKDHILHKEAIWIHDGELTLHLQASSLGDGHSLLKQKDDGKDPNISLIQARTVKCIDFSKWVGNNFSKSDELYMKMNIEGAEYAVVDKMLKDGTLDYFKFAQVSLHQHRFPNICSTEEHLRIKSEIQKRFPQYE